MPLPDERPRQSVANLIGRFELQTKRQSITSVPPRTSSALSGNGGDAAKTEAKEKREWPPKAKLDKEEDVKAVTIDLVVEETVPLRPSLPTPDASPKAEVSPLPKEPPPPEQPSASTADTAPEPLEQASAEVAPVEPPADPKPVPVPVPVRRLSTGAAPTVASRVPGTPSKGKAAAARPQPILKPTPARTAARSPPSSYHIPAALPPSSSAPSAIRPSASTRLAHSQSQSQLRSRPPSSASLRPPTTPARAKSPGPMRPKTPSSARPKTPSTAPRARTPASGLFAPTAASLAKARNAPENNIPPVPLKKQTLTPDVAERLSKPTAASLSKARTPTAHAVTSPTKAVPAKRGGVATRGAPPTRGTVVTKTRGAATAAKAKVPAGKIAAVHAHAGNPEVEVAGQDQHAADGALSADEHEEHHQEHLEEIVLHDEPEEAEVHDIEEFGVSVPQEAQSSSAASEHGEEDHDSDLPDSPSPTKFHHDDLADLVTMLEAKKPVLEDAFIAGEIPDEE